MLVVTPEAGQGRSGSYSGPQYASSVGLHFHTVIRLAEQRHPHIYRRISKRVTGQATDIPTPIRLQLN